MPDFLFLFTLLPWWAYLVGVCTVAGAMLLALAAWDGAVAAKRWLLHQPPPATSGDLLDRERAEKTAALEELSSVQAALGRALDVALRQQASPDAAVRAAGFSVQTALEGLPSLEFGPAPGQDTDTVTLRAVTPEEMP